ncbi:MAG: PilZ domain-containing protein [Elusimicrobia bacterium]|nr:PilZ domain-containing protein [Elusimicrobiota bacterium]
MRVIPEKRRAPRVKHDSVFEFFDESGAQVTCVASLFDFSTTGASFRSSHAFAKGDRVRARLHLLREGVLDIAGRIVRVKDCGNITLYGVKFDAVHPLGR